MSSAGGAAGVGQAAGGSRTTGSRTRYEAQATQAGLPGLRGLDHLGLCVRDLRAATTFFAEVLGWPVVFATGPFADPDGDWMSVNFGLHPRAVVSELAHVRTPFVNLELIEGSAPDQAREVPRMLDVGGFHVAVYVDDVTVAAAYLEAHGCTVLGAPKPFMGPEAGEDATFAHLRTPIGMYLELVSYPRGKAYEPEVDITAWNPAAPDALAHDALAGAAGHHPRPVKAGTP